jgi:hypothetical protein
MRTLVLSVVAMAFLFGGFATAEENAGAEKLKAALAEMKAKAGALGVSKAEGVSLYFGTTKLNGNYEIVDAIKEKFGCVATFFVKKDDSFIRISTNVQKEGNRAVGTKLDPNGKAIIAVAKGESYQGEADILGSAHITIYEPIKSEKGEVQGIYFVGIPK